MGCSAFGRDFILGSNCKQLWWFGLFGYLLANTLVALGFGIGSLVLPSKSFSPIRVPPTGILLIDLANQWDGQWYAAIGRNGYSYDPSRPSSVAFFPLLPLCGWVIAKLLNCSSQVANLAVSHVSLIAVFILMAAYCQRVRKLSATSTRWVLVAIALYPPGIFLSFAYSESLFLALVLAMFLSATDVDRPWLPALIAGLASAARPLGIVAAVPLLLAPWGTIGTWWRQVLRMFAVLVISTSGLSAYIVYQSNAFHEWNAFALNQDHWRIREKRSPLEKAALLLTGEPILNVYSSQSAHDWEYITNTVSPWLSLSFANPIFYLMALVSVLAGGARGLLTRRELIFSLLLLAIPYATRGYEMEMLSQARFTVVVFSLYIVWGVRLASAPTFLQIFIVGTMMFLKVNYAAHWAAGHVII